MKYQGRSDFQHGERAKLGVLITNLGTPEAPTPKALRKYLAQFLWDPRVVEYPRLLWKLILHGVILRIRPARSAKAYQTVWTEQGSPLLVHTQAQRDGLAELLAQRYGEGVEVAFAMRYGEPSIPNAIDKLMQAGVRKLVVLPLYPQYSGSTSASTFDALASDFTRRRWLPDLRFISHYHDYPAYIAAVAEKIKAHWAEHGRCDRLVLSYHGVPKQYLLKGDPYYCECYKTSRLIAEYLDLGEDDYITTFQSRFGREEWLQPYTDATLKGLPAQGVKSVQMVCPGFSADCLETIEEIGEENREYFMQAGGETYQYIECLNADTAHIDMMAQLVEDTIQDWVAQDTAEATQVAERAKALGAQR